MTTDWIYWTETAGERSEGCAEVSNNTHERVRSPVDTRERDLKAEGYYEGWIGAEVIW